MVFVLNCTSCFMGALHQVARPETESIFHRIFAMLISTDFVLAYKALFRFSRYRTSYSVSIDSNAPMITASVVACTFHILATSIWSRWIFWVCQFLWSWYYAWSPETGTSVRRHFLVSLSTTLNVYFSGQYWCWNLARSWLSPCRSPSLVFDRTTSCRVQFHTS